MAVWTPRGPEVESVATIISRVQKGLGVFAPGQVMIDPDCGIKDADQGCGPREINGHGRFYNNRP
jgi:methionine synthase II (cobalamin-independent)